MKTGVVQLLFSGQLRPRRTYDGEFVASRCGRFLRRIGGGETGAVWVPKVCALSSDRKLTELLVKSGHKVFHIESFSKENLQKLEKLRGGAGVAAGWLLGKGLPTGNFRWGPAEAEELQLGGPDQGGLIGVPAQVQAGPAEPAPPEQPIHYINFDHRYVRVLEDARPRPRRTARRAQENER